MSGANHRRAFRGALAKFPFDCSPAGEEMKHNAAAVSAMKRVEQVTLVRSTPEPTIGGFNHRISLPIFQFVSSRLSET